MEYKDKNMSLIKKDSYQKSIKKDVLYVTEPTAQKGQKISAAVYLVTAHIPENDPIRHAIRMHAVTLSQAALLPLQTEGKQSAIKAVTEALISMQSLLGTLLLGGLISEKNYAVLKSEIGFFIRSLELDTAPVREGAELTHEFFSVPEKAPAPAIKDTFVLPKGQLVKSFSINRTSNSIAVNDYKKDRSQEIISFINSKKVTSIKDISSIFPQVSEKTIQRELNRLLTAGKIKKRGNKRWSMYLSLDA